MKKKILTIITTMTMSAALIAGCGNAKEAKNADTTTEVQQPQAAVETTADVAETEKADAVTETTEAVETTETVETETEATVSADSKLDVKIIGTAPYGNSDGKNVTVFSFTNVSDEAICLGPGDVYNSDYAYDYVFRPGETSYICVDADDSLTEDDIRTELDRYCLDVSENAGEEAVLYTTEFTSDNFGDAVSLISENLNRIGTSRLVMCYKNDELVGVRQSLSIEGDSIENPFDADRIVIFWCEWVDL